MRDAVVGAVAVALVVALAAIGVGQAWRLSGPAWTAGLLSADPARQPAPPPVARALRRLAAVELVEHSRMLAARRSLPAGTLVLDLEALESLEAAQDLVQHWRSNHAAAAPLLCWLAGADEGPSLAAAVRVLSEEGCDVLRVARTAHQMAQSASVPTELR